MVAKKPKGVARKKGKKNRKWGRNKRKPSAQRYASSNRLENRKIRNLMKYCGMTRAQAMEVWGSK